MAKIITGFHSIEEKVRAGKNQPNLVTKAKWERLLDEAERKEEKF